MVELELWAEVTGGAWEWTTNIVPYGKHQCIRMSQKGGTFHPPADAFPTVETFDAFDRIAQHIRSVANVHP